MDWLPGVFRSRAYHAERAEQRASVLLAQSKRVSAELEVRGRVLERQREALLRAGVGSGDPRARACRAESASLQREREGVLARVASLQDALFRVRMSSIDRGRLELTDNLVRACAVAEGEIEHAHAQGDRLRDSEDAAAALSAALTMGGAAQEPVVDEAQAWDGEVDRRRAREVELGVAKSAAQALRARPVG